MDSIDRRAAHEKREDRVLWALTGLGCEAAAGGVYAASVGQWLCAAIFRLMTVVAWLTVAAVCCERRA